MKPEEALALVDNALSQINMSRADHIKAQEAIRVLSEAIKPKKEEKKD